MVSPVTSHILVTGGRGQVATALAEARPGGVHVVGRPDFDFDRPETIGKVLRAHAPALVVNAAAWTAVDAAEAAPEAARRANETGPAELARLCRQTGARLIHISTDYVFDGLKGAPYVEMDATNPTGIYGTSKLAGEIAVRTADPSAILLRTSWVYARTGRNFVRTMLTAARRASVLRVVSDQLGCPTSADDLARAILAVADRVLASPGIPGGLYHAAGSGETSWYGFATIIFDEAARHGFLRAQAQPIATADWPTPARRPPDSRLDCGLLHQTFGIRLPPWEASVRTAVAAICEDDDDTPGPGRYRG